MQYVYVLTNVHVPDLVKFGFSTRDPHNRATELSAPTGVPGRWTVHHYWEVEEGFAVEQAIFKRLNAHRLERQEFFRLPPNEAVRVISEQLRIVGTNPLEKARLEAEAQTRAHQEAADQRAKEREALLAKGQALEERKRKILQQIKEEQAPVLAAMNKRRNTILIVAAATVFALGFFVNVGKGVTMALLLLDSVLLHSVGWFFKSLFWPLFVSLFFPFIVLIIIELIRFFIDLISNRSKFEAQLSEIETRVLASHGLRSRRGLNIYEGEPRTMSRP